MKSKLDKEASYGMTQKGREEESENMIGRMLALKWELT